MNRPGWLDDAERIDLAVYTAVAGTESPTLDRVMRGLTRAADNSKLSLAAAAGLVAFGGRRGRRAAITGLTAVGVTSAAVNLGVKYVVRRPRPDRVAAAVPEERHVAMPTTRSFPSGHSAAAFAFASGVGEVLPVAAFPLYGLACVVAYSRVHTGVHYPGDVLIGSVFGVSVAHLTSRALRGRLPA